MTGLASRHYERMLDLAVAIVGSRDQHEVWPLVAEELVQSVGGAFVIFSQVRWATRTGRVEAAAPVRLNRLPLNALLDKNLGNDHPLARHYATTGDRTPLAITDIVDDNTWRRSEVYRATRAVLGTTRHIALPLDAPAGTVRAFVIHRDGRDFTDHDRNYLRRLQPLLHSVDHHLRELRGGHDSTLDADGPAERATEAGLTPREMTVLALLADGLTVQAMARRLGISPRTVAKHYENLYRKLRTSDRLGTVLRAQALGLLPSPRTPQLMINSG